MVNREKEKGLCETCFNREECPLPTCDIDETLACVLHDTTVFSGKPTIEEVDISMYTDGHDLPYVCIGGIPIAFGEGYDGSMYPEKDENHLLWKLDLDAEYEVIIRKKERKEGK